MLVKCGITVIPTTCWLDISLTALKSVVLLAGNTSIGHYFVVFAEIITEVVVELAQIYYLPTTGV